jgi:PemK-like, MazF-like toxin of type II toxin-antitoxin system
MAEGKPAIGLVIRHAYLWWNEARKGREEGRKDRPCVIVHVRQNEFRETEVFICPVTHTPPEHPERAMQIPLQTKARLGLDAQASWIITTEVNLFIWPGPDIRPVPGGGPAYGLLPAAMSTDLVEQVKRNSKDRSLLVVRRDDTTLTQQMRQREKTKNKPEE